MNFSKPKLLLPLILIILLASAFVLTDQHQKITEDIEKYSTQSPADTIEIQESSFNPMQFFSFMVSDSITKGENVRWESSIRIDPDGDYCGQNADDYPKQYAFWLEGEGTGTDHDAYLDNGDSMLMYCDGTYTEVELDLQAPDQEGEFDYDLQMAGNPHITAYPLYDQQINYDTDTLTVEEPQQEEEEEEEEEEEDDQQQEEEEEEEQETTEDAYASMDYPSEITEGELVEFSASSSSGEGSLVYEWEINGDQISTSETFTHIFEEESAYSVELMVEGEDGDVDYTSTVLDVDAQEEDEEQEQAWIIEDVEQENCEQTIPVSGMEMFKTEEDCLEEIDAIKEEEDDDEDDEGEGFLERFVSYLNSLFGLD